MRPESILRASRVTSGSQNLATPASMLRRCAREALTLYPPARSRGIEKIGLPRIIGAAVYAVEYL